MGIAAALGFASQQQASAEIINWTGAGGATPGDGSLWVNGLNWANDSVPTAFDDVVFANPPAGLIHLGGNQTVNQLTFEEDFTLGAYGTNQVLTNTLGSISVQGGSFATINASLSGTNGLILSGGGSLFLNNPLPQFSGNISVDGAGTTLVYRGEGPYPQYNGLGNSAEFGRFDSLGLGYTTVARTITLTSGGELKIIGAGNNPESNHKGIIIGAGGGTLNLAPGYLVQNLDDNGQLVATTEAFTKAGKGRLIITGTMATGNPLQGVVNINGGMLSLDNQASGRFLGVAASAVVNINNGGTLMLNNGGAAAAFDVVTVNLNDGGTLAFNGAQTHFLGSNTGGTTLNVTGTGNLLFRDLYGTQTERLYRIRTDITGNGTIVAVPNTNAGGNPRMVIERNTSSAFTGTFRLIENMALEGNPREMPIDNTGKLIGQGDIDFAGWGSRLDLRDSTDGSVVLDYVENDLRLTSPQVGSVSRISVLRGDGAFGTGHLYNFGSLTMGSQRLIIDGNNAHQVGISKTALIQGDAEIMMGFEAAQNNPIVFSNATAISEDAAGRSLTFSKFAGGNAPSRDVIVGGSVGVSNLELQFGILQLRGADGRIGTGFGGAPTNVVISGGAVTGATRDMPTAGLLHLDNNTGHTVGTTGVIVAGNSANRVDDTAVLNLRGNSGVRLTSANNAQSTETLGTVNVGGHSLFDVVKTGTAPAPVALTINGLALGANATANFTGTSLGSLGGNASRIVLPGTVSGIMGAQYHSGNEWARYDAGVDSGVELGVTAFGALDYVVNSTEDTWATGQYIKNNAAASTITLTGNRNIARYSSQMTGTTTATTGVNVNGFILTLEEGGILNSGITSGLFDSSATPSLGGITAGTTAPSKLYVYSNSQLDIRVPVRDNLGADGQIGGGDDGMVDFVKTGTGTVRLTHQSLGVGVGNQGGSVPPFTSATWESTLTGSWIINDGSLNVHRGQFLGGRPVVLNGGTLEINHPVPTSMANSILPGWGNDLTVNGNAMLGMDDNGESADPGVGGNTIALLGSLTINNGSALGHGSFNNLDVAFMEGATFNGRATINIGPNRTATNGNMIINGALTGDGFDMISLVGAPQTVVLGGTQTDSVNNTFTSEVRLYGGILRMNKANGSVAIPDTAADEDVVINGGTLAWGPGHHGDLATTNNLSTTNNGVVGIVPLSPAAIKNAGMNQIADTASVTLLTGALGEADRINNEVFGTLIQKNGTLNVGLGTMEIGTATISGGNVVIDRGGTLKIGNLDLLPGSPDLNVTTGIASPGVVSTLEVGAGGLSMTGQNVVVGSGGSANLAGAGGVLKLGGDVTVQGSDLIGGSYGRKGIFVQIGNSFRELGDSRVDLAGGNRTFDIDEHVQFFVTAPLTNGGLIKAGGGGLVLEPYKPSAFAGAITVNDGTLWARGNGAFGTSAGGVAINEGGTVKLESSWVYGDAFTVSGRGATVPGEANVFEPGALISETGTNRLTGAVTVAGNATIASNTVIDVSVTPTSAGAAFRLSNLRLENAAGITGSGTVTLSGHSDGVIFGGVNTTAGGLVKDGAGRWSIQGASSMTGPVTIGAGNLRISHGNALGGTAAGTTVFGGAVEMVGGISVAEPFLLYGNGNSVQSGALVNVSSANTISGEITLNGSVTLRSLAGSMLLTGAIQGTDGALTLAGAGNGRINGVITTGGPGLPGLIKTGTGKWTLAGDNALSGTTTIAGGTLELDFTTQNLSKLNAGEFLALTGGSLSLIPHASGSTQLVAGLDVLAGGGSITVGGGIAPAVLSVGTINHAAGGTVNFNIGSNGGVLTTSGAVNGILGGFATVANENWATTSGSEIVAFTAYAPMNVTGGADAENSLLTSSARLSAGLLTNSLKIDGGAGVALDANTLTLTSGGLLFTGDRPAAIIGDVVSSALSANDELIVHTSGGTMELAVPLTIGGLGDFTKAGSGKVVLSGNSAFGGAVNITGGTLSIVGPGGTTHPTALGSSGGPRNLNINGGTFEVVGGDYDSGATNMYYVIGSAGATIRSQLGAIITINDTSGPAPGQLSGSGDLTFTGGGRYHLSGGSPQFSNFTGNVTVDGGILNVGNGGAAGIMPVGASPDQTITLRSGSVIINQVNFGLGQNGLVNNIVAEGGVHFHTAGGSRVYSGNIQLAGRNTVAIMERDNLSQDRQIFFNGRVSGQNVTLDVFGVNNGAPFYLTSGSNELTGTINLNTNAVLEARMPGSLGINDGDVTINLNGANSRLFLRHYQNADYRNSVVVNANAEINSDRLVSYGGGGNQMLSIHNLTSNTNGILTFGGGNNYMTRVEGTATLNANTILNTSGSHVLFDNGITFAGAASILDKRGATSMILHGPSNHTGATLVTQGILLLQNLATMASTESITIRGGELRVDNSVVVNPDRLNDAAPITLAGGALRITGSETIGTVTATNGTTQIVYNPTSETAVTALTLPGFTRETGAVIQFQSPDAGIGAVGATTLGGARISSRILIPNVADTTQTIPGFLGNNSLDFIQYNGSTIDNGVPLGVRDMRNPGTTGASPTNYTNDPLETAWDDGVIARLSNAADNTTSTTTLTSDRALDAIKVETGGTNRIRVIDVGGAKLRIEGGGILDVAATGHRLDINGTGGLTAGPATPGANIAELFIGGTGVININAPIVDNGSQRVALVKTGAGTLNLAGANTHKGGTFMTAGILNATVSTAFGDETSPITLSGGNLQFNIPSAGTAADLGVPDHAITVKSNSLMILDNGTGAGTDNDITLGSLTIDDSSTLGVRGFDSMDVSFTGSHTFNGTPTIDLPQLNNNATGGATTVTIAGPISGSGFNIASTGGATGTAPNNTDNSAARLQIGAGESQSNTYVGRVTIHPSAAFGEDVIIELNKAADTTAITGDLQLDGGTVVLNASNQIADTSKILLNRGVLNLNGNTETIASVEMAGGGLITNPTTGTPVANSVTITGDVKLTGHSNFAGVNTGFTVGNNSTVSVAGLLQVGTYGRVHLAEGASGSFLDINGGLEMTGALIHQNSGAGPNTIRLNSDVTTFAAAVPSNIGNSTDSDTFMNLNGPRTFTVADGVAGIDLSISTVVQDGTTPGLLVKSGEGTVQIQGGGTANNYTGGTVINSGSVVLFKNENVNAIPVGLLAIGDGLGGERADKVIVRNSHQIGNAADVVIASSGLLDLDTFNRSETIGSLSGSGNIDLGPTSVLTVDGPVNTTYAGSIYGAGSFAKAGSSLLELTGVNEVLGGTTVDGTGSLIVNGVLGGAVTVNAGATLGGDGSILGSVTVNDGILSPGNSPGSLDIGSLTLLTGTLLAEFESRASHDFLNVTGTVTLGGNLMVNFGAGPFPGLDALALIINDGVDAVNGTFSGLSEGALVGSSGGLNFFISYQGNVDGGATPNDVVLFVPEPGSATLLLGGLGSLLAMRRRRNA